MLDMPDGSQLIIQGEGWGGNWDEYWNIIYAPNGDFILAGCAANICPSATTSGKIINLLGTPNGNGVSVCSGSATANLTQCVMEDAPDADGCYPFIVMEFIAPNDLKFALMIDTFTQRKSDLMAAHARTYLAVTDSGIGVLTRTRLDGSSWSPATYIDFGGAGEAWAWARYPAISMDGGYLYPGSAGYPAAGAPDHPIDIGNRTHGGEFGLSALLKWQATSRNYPDTNAAKTEWYVEDVVIAMGDGVTDPLAIP
jgi:hypothetical protein